MKKPVVDYRTFRFSRINEPQFAHLKYLLGWVGYFALYFLTENLIPAERCTPIHCWLDDLIPFNELFLIPYTFWYVLIVISLAYFMLYDPDSFKKLMSFIIFTQIVAVCIYIIFPSRQDLRPTEFERDNILTQLMAFIYAFDTNTGVFPSLHVAYSIGIASVWCKTREAVRGWKIFVVIAVILICISTTFVKQHSALDVFAAIPLSFFAECVIFGKCYWLPKLKRRK